jgi:Zn-dependent protease with chaperone function
MTPFLPNSLCFGSDLPGAGLPCRTAITPSGLTLQWEGRPSQAVPFSLLTVGAGGFDHDQLVVSWASGTTRWTLYLKEAALIRAFREAAPPGLLDQVEMTAGQVRRARASRRTWLLSAVMTIALLMAGLWFSADAIVALAVNRIPVEWERQIGESARAEFLAGHHVLRDGPVVEAVQEITKRLTEQIPTSPYRFDVTLVRSDTVNAFALPGGFVVVCTGLLKKAETPDEVAGVLGHELSHVLHRHGLQRTVKTLGLVAVVSIFLGNQEGLVSLAKQLGIELISLKFGREQETEADVEGLRLVHRAKIDPAGLVRFFRRLAEADKLPIELLSTHPMSASRAERLQAEASSLVRQEPVPFGFDWNAIQSAV